MRSFINRHYFLSGVILLHILFFLLTLHYKRLYMGDSYEHVYMALNIKDHFLFYAANADLPLFAKYYTLRPPVYSLFLLLVYFFSINNWIVLLVQNLISIWNVLYLRKTILLLGYRSRYDWLLLLFIAAYPAQFIFADTIAPDILLQSFVLIYVRHLLLFAREGKASNAWMMNVALLMGMFTKPILYPFLVLHILLLLWYGRKNILRNIAAPVVVLVSIVLLYNYWNEQRTGKFHFTSIQPFNAMYYNVRLFEEQQLGKEQASLFMTHEKTVMESQPTFIDWYNYGNRRSLEILRTHPGSYLSFHLRYTMLFFIYPGRNEIDLFTGNMTYGRFYRKTDKRILDVIKELPPSKWWTYFTQNSSLVAMLIILLFNLIKTAGFIVFLSRRAIPMHYRVVITLIIGYFAFMTGPLVNTRYCLPVSLLYIGCGVLGLTLLQPRSDNKQLTAS